MNTFKRFLSVSLIAVMAMGSSLLFASDCGSCSNSCSTSTCSTNASCDDSCDNGCRGCSSIVIGRSTLDNSAYFDGTPYAYLEACEFNTGLVVGYEYLRTFRDCKLAQCLVGNALNGNQLVFQGSKASNAAAVSPVTAVSGALIADNFGLSQEFSGSIALNPRIQSNNLNFQWYFGFDGWTPGLYMLLDFSFSNQKRSLFGDCNNGCDTGCDNGCSSSCSTNSCSSSCNTDCNSCCTTTPAATVANNNSVVPFPVGYMNGAATTATATSIQQALSGTFLFGDMQTPWNFGKWNFCDMKANKVAGFAVNLGYNFWVCDDSHFGIFARYVAPTGTHVGVNQKFGDYFFAPVVGLDYNQLGGGLTLHKQLWSNDCGDTITMFINGYATHLFKTCTVRSFDFIGDGCMSRYMLLKQLTPSTTTPTTYSYAGSLINAINFNTRIAESSFDVLGDAAIRFIYKHNNFSAAIGYNVFGRSGEKLCIRQTNNIPSCGGTNALNANNVYGIKGCLGVASYPYAAAGGVTTTTPPVTGVPLAATATDSATITSCGTITAGTAGTAGVTSPTTADFPVIIDAPTGATNTTATSLNAAWDTKYFPASGAGLAQANAIPATTAVSSILIAYNSVQSVPVTIADLDVASGAASRMITNKGFVQLNYVWDDCCWSPFLGVGGEVEAGSKCCDINQWGVWVQVGLGF